MRLFVAIDLDDDLRQRIAKYLQELSGFAPEARWAAPDSLHVTLKFIGEQPEERIPRVQDALSTVRSQPISVAIRGYGFFPTSRAARVFWLGLEAPEALPNLARQVDTAMATLGVPREEHRFTPHLTLARSGSGAPRLPGAEKASLKFDRLQKQLLAMPQPDFGRMTAREFFLYQSQLSPKGSHYTKLARFPLTH